MQIRYPANASLAVQHDQLIHQINAKYIRAILYTILARGVSNSSSAEELPKTAFCSRSPPSSPAAIKHILYKNVFDRYTDIQQLIQPPSGNTAVDQTFGELVEREKQKLIVLAPLAFEAILFMHCLRTTNASDQGPPMVDELSLHQVIDQTLALNSPRKTYSIFADMILSAFSRTSASSNQLESQQPVLPASITVNLLKKLVNRLRHQANYDIQQGTKWVRCMIQVILDQRESNARNPPSDPTSAGDAAMHVNDDKKTLNILAKLTDQGLHLARSNHDYPIEELQWLATTLFNLAVDMYMSSFPPTSDGSDARTSIGNTGPAREDDVTSPQFWAKKAVEFADVLALNTTLGTTADGSGNTGDGDRLARTLREKCQRFHWDV